MNVYNAYLNQFAGDSEQRRQHHGSVDHQFISPGESSFQHRLAHVDAPPAAGVSAAIDALDERGSVELEDTLALCDRKKRNIQFYESISMRSIHIAYIARQLFQGATCSHKQNAREN